MSIRVALHHTTSYEYERPIRLSPQIVRLRPAPHCRTPVTAYSLRVEPAKHFINWQQDPQGNYLARLVFPDPVERFKVEIDLIADMTVINPFDFFLEESAEFFPFQYESWLSTELKPFLVAESPGPHLAEWLNDVDRSRAKTVSFLVDLNRRLHADVRYLIRMEPGVQTCEETLERGQGSCRDSAWLLVQILRNLGLAARFVSGYLIQLTPDVKALDGPNGPEQDFTDLHAWVEVYLPGAGWVGLDPTSGLLAGEGHVPLAATPDPQSAAPISGMVEPCETQFSFSMSVSRIHEDPRVTKPYTDEQWQAILSLGHEIDERLVRGDVRLTMGGEPTFVSIDDMESDEWRTAATGPQKRRLADALLSRLKNRFAPTGLLHFGQGKWYPGESLPRWSMACYWRRDEQPIWRDARWFAKEDEPTNPTVEDAERFARELASRLSVAENCVLTAYEDSWYYLWRERRLPINVDARFAKLDNEEERARLARVFEGGINKPVGCVLPLRFAWWQADPRWTSGPWPVRADQMFLIPGDSPMGFRLPLTSLPLAATTDSSEDSFPRDPMSAVAALPSYDRLRRANSTSDLGQLPTDNHRKADQQARIPLAPIEANATTLFALSNASTISDSDTRSDPLSPYAGEDISGFPSHANGHRSVTKVRPGASQHASEDENQRSTWSAQTLGNADTGQLPYDDLIRTALCVEPREGHLYVFMPPVDRLEPYLALVAAIEDTAEYLQMPVRLEGYLPPNDYRLNHLRVAPDPGVIEVNVHPAHSWDELVDITSSVYQDAYRSRLGTERFDRDGTHTGTGGGNHVVLGGPRPSDSPFLRRPELLRSLVGYWHNHPSLSYLFSGSFIGPTSQAPRVDEGRRDAVYELQIAFEQIPDGQECPPWLVDRVFRHLLVDITGNTHRAEFCIDKLFSPDSATGRLGLVEFRAFEMPPHAKMSLTQQLLLRALVARFWEQSYRERLVDWGTAIHDRCLLPHFLWRDFEDVIEETATSGMPIQLEWFAPHFEFRFPKIGEIVQRDVHLELRRAIEPWYVLGEESAGSYTARYVDSSVERMQVKVAGLVDTRHTVLCNGRVVPLHPTGTEGEFVAGVRYRAWQPPSCLHPTIPVDEPLVFDIVDTWMGRSIGGCRYYTGHPGGLNPESFPVNAYEAESRRASRFFRMGHTGGPVRVPPREENPRFPFTLDLRRLRQQNSQ